MKKTILILACCSVLIYGFTGKEYSNLELVKAVHQVESSGRTGNNIIGDNGKSLKTPARISRNQGIIEVSKLKFSKYSVPMRMAILLHEFSHFYLNSDMANETEADLNALIIYLGLGYPRIDAYNVFTQVFHTSPTELNKDRMKIIDDFIRNFENKYIDMQYSSDSLYKNYI